MLSKTDRPTAIVAFNDVFAIRVIQQARQLRLHVPGDLSVVGFDDSSFSQNNDIPITTINPKPNELGRAVIDMLIEKIENSNNNELNRIFLCGHSLGGAVAAISQNILNILNVEITTTVFGAPRYCNSEFLLPSLKNLPTQFRNYGDIVPFTPPRKMGYVDHPREYDTNGYLFQPVINQGAIGAVKGAWDGMKRGGSFFLNKCEPHNMENYRKNLGSLSDANDWEAPLTTLYAELQGHNF